MAAFDSLKLYEHFWATKSHLGSKPESVVLVVLRQDSRPARGSDNPANFTAFLTPEAILAHDRLCIEPSYGSRVSFDSDATFNKLGQERREKNSLLQATDYEYVESLKKYESLNAKSH